MTDLNDLIRETVTRTVEGALAAPLAGTTRDLERITLLSPQQVAERMGVHHRTVRAWVAVHPHLAVHLGEQTLRIKPWELAALIERPDALTARECTCRITNHPARGKRAG